MTRGTRLGKTDWLNAGLAALAAQGPAALRAEALARQDFKISRITTTHSARVATMDDLARALEAEVFQAMR